MPVTLDINKAYAASNAYKFNSKKSTEDLLDRKISTGKMNLIQNGLLSSKGLDKRVSQMPDLRLLSQIDFSKVNSKSAELANGRSLNEVVKKLVKYAKA